MRWWFNFADWLMQMFLNKIYFSISCSYIKSVSPSHDGKWKTWFERLILSLEFFILKDKKLHRHHHHHNRIGGRLTENQLIKIVFYQLIKTFIISWPKFLTLFSWSKNSINCQKRTDRFWQLIKSFINVIFAF